jgi:hypothetical protein
MARVQRIRVIRPSSVALLRRVDVIRGQYSSRVSGKCLVGQAPQPGGTVECGVQADNRFAIVTAEAGLDHGLHGLHGLHGFFNRGIRGIRGKWGSAEAYFRLFRIFRGSNGSN